MEARSSVASAMARLRGLVSQFRRLRPLGIGSRGGGDWTTAVRTAAVSSKEPHYEPEPARWNPADPLPADDSVWQHYSKSVQLLPHCTASEFEAVAADVAAYKIFPPQIMKITTRFERGAMQPGDQIVQRIPLLPAVPTLVQTLAVIRVCEVLCEPSRRGFVVATTVDHEEIASHTLWVERCSVSEALLLHSRGCSRWAEHVPRWLWHYTRARYQQGHLALRRHLLKRAKRVQATRRGLVSRTAVPVHGGNRQDKYRIGHAMLNPRLQGWPPPPWLPGIELIFAEPPGAKSSMPPVIFLHGAFHSAATFEDTFLPLFASRGVAAYAVSVTGAGLSTDLQRNRQAPRLDQWLADLDVAIDEVARRNDGQAPIIVGHSIGGGVAQVYAADSVLSRKIAGLGLLSAFPPSITDGVAVLLRMVAAVVKDRQIGEMILAGLLNEGLRTVAPTASEYQKLMGSCGAGASAECVRDDAPHVHKLLETEHLQLEPSASWVLPFQVMMRLNLFKYTDARGGRCALPCVVLGCERDEDRLISRGALERTAECYGVRAISVPGVGHAMMARAGGNWEVAACTLLYALREAHVDKHRR